MSLAYIQVGVISAYCIKITNDSPNGGIRKHTD